MHFDTALNLVWLLLGSVALGSSVYAIFYSRCEENRQSRRLHIVGLGLIVLALFPYISATDDVLRIEHFSSQHEAALQPTKQHSSSTPNKGHSGTDNLMRLYEVMDSPLICRVCEFSLTFVFIAFAVLPAIRLLERPAPRCAGRSPPVF